MVQELAPGAGGLSYSYRERVGDSVRMDVSDDGVRFRSTKAGSIDAPWRDVKRIGLISPVSGVYVCVIETSQGKVMRLANRSVAGPGEFRSQNSAFLDFVWKLHARAAKHRHVRFRAGNAGWYYFAVISLILLGVLLLSLAGLMVWAMATDRLRRLPPLWVAGTLAFVAPVLVHWARKNRARDYDPLAIPDDLLPARGEG